MKLLSERSHAVAVRLFSLALVVLFASSHAGFAQEDDALIEDFAGAVEASIANLGGNTVVVPPLPYADGIKSIEGTLIAERLVARLTARTMVRVVERAALDKVMEEQKLSALGFVDAHSSVQIGKLLGAKGILCGSITDLGERIEIHARLIRVESGEVVSTFDRSARKTVKSFISPLWARMDEIRKENESFSLRLWADQKESVTAIPHCRIGDLLTLHFQAERDCYLTIFDFTTSGSVRVLFPNGFMPDNHIKANQLHTFPDPQAGFRIRVKDPPGIERLKAFATTNKTPLFEEDFSVEKFRSVTQESYTISRDIESVLENLGDNAWAEADLELQVEPLLRQ